MTFGFAGLGLGWQDEGGREAEVLADGQRLVHDVVLGHVAHAAAHLRSGCTSGPKVQSKGLLAVVRGQPAPLFRGRSPNLEASFVWGLPQPVCVCDGNGTHTSISKLSHPSCYGKNAYIHI